MWAWLFFYHLIKKSKLHCKGQKLSLKMSTKNTHLRVFKTTCSVKKWSKRSKNIQSSLCFSGKNTFRPQAFQKWPQNWPIALSFEVTAV